MRRRITPAARMISCSMLLALSLGVVAAAEEASDGQAPAALRNATAVCLDFSRDSRLVASGGDAIRIHEVASGRQLYRLSPPKHTSALAFSPSAGDLLASGDGDGVVRLWRVGESEPVRLLKGHSGVVTPFSTGPIMDLAFSPDGKLLASCAGFVANGELTLWNVETGEVVNSLKYPDHAIHRLAFSPDGDRLAFIRSQGGFPFGHDTAGGGAANLPTVQVYRVAPWQRTSEIAYWPGGASAIAIAPDDGRLLIAGGESLPMSGPMRLGTASSFDLPPERGYVWSAELGIDRPATPLIAVPSGRFHSVNFVPAGELFATGAAEMGGHGGFRKAMGRIQLWSTLTKQAVWTVETDLTFSLNVAVSPDGKLVGACGWTDRIQLLDARNGNAVRSITLTR